MKTRVTTITCLDCKSEIYSRARHDYRTCVCGGIAVDGGLDYTRFVWKPTRPKPTTRIRYVPFTKSDLYQDWNHRIDSCGFIKGSK